MFWQSLNKFTIQYVDKVCSDFHIRNTEFLNVSYSNFFDEMWLKIYKKMLYG
jgi:hypothetical protein